MEKKYTKPHMNERDLRRKLEKIEVKYLHTSKSKLEGDESSRAHTAPTLLFKMTAAQK